MISSCLGTISGRGTDSPMIVPPGRKARHVADTDRVGMAGEHDGDRPGRLSGGLHLSRGGREDEVDFQTDQVGRHFGQPFGRLGPSKHKVDVVALDIAVM